MHQPVQIYSAMLRFAEYSEVYLSPIHTGRGTPFNSVCVHILLHAVSAMADSDFTTLSMDVHFDVGSMDGATVCINVPIIDDSSLEEDETFTVSLTVTAGAPNVGNAMTMVTIYNDDSRLAIHCL